MEIGRLKSVFLCENYVDRVRFRGFHFDVLVRLGKRCQEELFHRPENELVIQLYSAGEKSCGMFPIVSCSNCRFLDLVRLAKYVNKMAVFEVKHSASSKLNWRLLVLESKYATRIKMIIILMYIILS